MNTVILGAGALGCIIGGFLAKTGYDVTLIGRRRSHTDTIRQIGLTITGVKGTHTVKVKATHDPSEVKSADLLILLTKTMDTTTALDSVSHLYPVVKCAVSLQNGVVKDERLRERFGAGKVIGGTTLLAGTLLGDGRVQYTSDGITSFGEFDGRRTARVNDLEEMFNRSGLKAEVVDDIHSVEWTKLMFAVPFMASSSLTRLECHRIMQNRFLASLYVQMARECIEVAKRDGAEIQDYPGLGLIKDINGTDFDGAVQAVINEGLRWEQIGRTSVVSSMLQSIVIGKKTEVEETIGYVAKKGKLFGVNTPTVQFAYEVIKGIDAYLK